MKLVWTKRDMYVARWCLGVVMIFGVLASFIYSAYDIGGRDAERIWRREVAHKNEQILILKCIPLREDFGYTFTQLETLASRPSMCDTWRELFSTEGFAQEGAMKEMTYKRWQVVVGSHWVVGRLIRVYADSALGVVQTRDNRLYMVKV